MPKEIVTGGYQCFHCLTNGVYWQGDFSFEDYGLEGEGIVRSAIAPTAARILNTT